MPRQEIRDKKRLNALKAQNENKQKRKDKLKSKLTDKDIKEIEAKIKQSKVRNNRFTEEPVLKF